MTITSRQERRSRTHPRVTASAAVRGILKKAASRLREAAGGDLSPKALHELRIACRRAEAALRLCEDAADGRASRWLMRRLKSLRSACNDARDDDVLCKWVQLQGRSSSKSLCEALRDHRAEVQPRIVELARWLNEKHRFERRSQKVVKQLQACELKELMARAFGQRLFDEVYRFVKSLPANRDDLSVLHRLRIIGKRLRYASELVTEIWPDVALAELNEHLHLLQDRLGSIHDQVVGARRLSEVLPKRLAHTARPHRAECSGDRDTSATKVLALVASVSDRTHARRHDGRGRGFDKQEAVILDESPARNRPVARDARRVRQANRRPLAPGQAGHRTTSGGERRQLAEANAQRSPTDRKCRRTKSGLAFDVRVIAPMF